MFDMIQSVYSIAGLNNLILLLKFEVPLESYLKLDSKICIKMEYKI